MKGSWSVWLSLLLLLASLLVVAVIEFRAPQRMISTMTHRMEQLADENFLLKQEIHRLRNDNLSLQERAGRRSRKLVPSAGRGLDRAPDTCLPSYDGRGLTDRNFRRGEGDAADL